MAYNGAVSAPAPLRIAPIFAAPFASAVPAGAAELNAELAPLPQPPPEALAASFTAMPV